MFQSILAGLNQEANLYKTLFDSGYNPALRPREDVSSPVVVSLEFELSTLSDLVSGFIILV